MRAICKLREFFRAGVRALRIFRGRHSSSPDAFGEWDMANKPYSPLHVWAIPVKSSNEFYNFGSNIPPEDGDKLPVLFRVDDANLSGAGGNWVVGDPVWTFPEAKEVYFVQHYYDNPNQPNDRLKEVKLEYGDNHYAKQSLDATISLPSNGVTYNPGYLYPRVKVFFPKPPPFNCTPPPPPTWRQTMQSSVSMSEPVIIDLVLDGDETEGAPGGTYKWYWAPDITNPLNGSGVPNLVHSNIIICGNEFGLANVDAEFMDRHQTRTPLYPEILGEYIEHSHIVSTNNQLVQVDLFDPAARALDFTRVTGLNSSDSDSFHYSDGMSNAVVRGHATSGSSAASENKVDVRWSTLTIGGFEPLQARLWNFVSLPGGGGDWQQEMEQYVLAQSNTDFVFITAHGGFGNPWGTPTPDWLQNGSGRPITPSGTPDFVIDDGYLGSNISLMFILNEDADPTLMFSDNYLRWKYQCDDIEYSRDPGHTYSWEEASAMLGPRELSRFFDSTTTDYNSDHDDSQWLLLNTCRTLSFTSATKWKQDSEYIYSGNQRKHNYYVNAIRNWRRLLAGVPDDPVLDIRGDLQGILGWYGSNFKDTSEELVTAYTEALQGGGGYDVSFWANPPFDPHRNIYHWLQTAAKHQMYINGDPQQGYRTWYYFEDVKNSPIQNKLLYNKAGFFVCALDESGTYYYLANAKNGWSNFQWRRTNAGGLPLPPLKDPETLPDETYFQVTAIKIQTGFWSPIYDNYAAWRIP